MNIVSYKRSLERLNYLNVCEVLDPSYGMYVWPCAPVLAQYIWFNRSRVHNQSVLELGAGTSLPGIVAAKCGGEMILSDAIDLERCRENCRRSCQENDLHDIPVIGLTWGQFHSEILNLKHVDIILGSDCFYDSKDFEDVIVTVAFIVKKNPLAEFWCTYQERSSDRSIETLLLKWNLQCVPIPLASFDADSPCIAESKLPGNHTIQMLVIKKS